MISSVMMMIALLSWNLDCFSYFDPFYHNTLSRDLLKEAEDMPNYLYNYYDNNNENINAIKRFSKFERISKRPYDDDKGRILGRVRMLKKFSPSGNVRLQK